MSVVLVVDDERGLRKSISVFIERNGHHVLVAEDVPTAVDIIKNSEVDVIVSDIVLPGQSGIDLLQYVHDNCSDIPVIMISGEPTIKSTVRSMRLGAFDFLAKPVPGKDLCQIVEQAARKKAHTDKARHALTESEARFQRLTENLQDVIWRTDITGKVQYVNTACEEMLGYTPKEAIGKEIEEYLTLDSVMEINKLFQRLITENDSNPSFRVEATYKHKEGHTVLCEMNVSCLKNRKGHIVALEGITRDISESKRAQERLAQSERKFRLIFENTRDAIFWANPEDGMLINCNKAAEELLERSRNEIIGQHQSFLHPPVKSEHFSRMFKRHVSNVKEEEEFAEVITRTGKHVPVHISATVTTVGDERIIQGIFYDLRELFQLEQNKRLLALAIEQFSNGYALIDREGILLFCNSSYAKLHGIETEQCIGKAQVSFYAQNERPRIETALSTLFESGPIAGEFMHRNASGTDFEVYQQFHPIFDEQQYPLAILETLHNKPS